MNNIIQVQPALPRYRMDYFARLARHYGPAMAVYYSPGSLGALTQPVSEDWAKAVGPMRWFFGGIGWQSGVAWLKLRQDDIIVLSGNPRQISTLILLIRAKLCGARVIWWGHYWSSTSRRWRQLIRHLPMAIADAILFYTDDEVHAFQSDTYLRKRSRCVTALNNGIDIVPIQKLRHSYSAVEREPALLFVGRLTEKAELGLVLEALALLGEQAPMLHLIGDGEQCTALQVRARNLGLEGKIVWHGALTDEARIAEIANNCRAFIYPGAVGLSLIHAMAYGLPCIVHDNPAQHMPEIAAFQHGETGLAFRRGSATALAESMSDLLSDRGRLDNMSEACIARTTQAFNTRVMALRFIALVETLTGPAGSALGAGRISS